MLVKLTRFKIVKGRLRQWSQSSCFVPAIFRGQPTEVSVRKALRSVFLKAKRAKMGKIIFSLSGLVENKPIGQTGFSSIGAAKIVAQEILRFCRTYPDAFKEMVLVIADRATFQLFEKQVYGYIRHIQEDLSCGPYATVDMIIAYQGGFVVIERTNPPYGFALPGGFVDNGETLEQAAIREAKEETNLDLKDLRQFHTYSDPARDPRFQTISTVFTANGKGKLRFGDDAKGAQVMTKAQIFQHDFAFDHKEIICDYLKTRGKF